ncbi:MAG: DNA-3-methyladenine glycosylase I [Bacteroidota bacterium]
MKRCPWPGEDALMIAYHDDEWGVPLHDDQKLFEFIVLDTFQAGLSWKTILHKRENFRKAFDQFDYRKIALYDPEKIDRLIGDASIIRNKSKIYGTVQNANAFMRIQEEFGSFDQYLWGFTEGKTIKNHWTSISEVPARTELSDRVSKDLVKRGFKFAGSTIIYAFMQAAGVINDHLVTCPRFSL